MRTFFYQIPKEKLLCRTPSLFAYISFNELGEYELHKATDSPSGCYGKIVESVKLTNTYVFSIDGDNITLKAGEIYSYRTLIDYYYKCKKDEKEKDNSFIKYIDKAIGIRYISENDFPRDRYDLVSDVIYIAAAKSQYEWFVKRKMLCDAYNRGIENGMDVNKHICCDCDEFERKGGEKMMNLLLQYINEAETIASEYKGYAVENGLDLKFGINLTSTINDMGVMSEYIDVWKSGVEYNIGDMVFYDGNSYVCSKKTTGYWDEDKETILFPYNIDNNHANDAFELIKDTKANGKYIPSDDTTYGDKFFIADANNACLPSADDSKIHIDGYSDSKLKSLRRYKDYVSSNGSIETPNSGYDWLYYYRLNSVVDYTTLNDDYGNIAFFTDKTKEEKLALKGKECNDIYAYGNIITNIKIPEEYIIQGEPRIVFEYYIGCHLKATCIDVKEDDDGNVLYYFDDFKIDKDDVYHGVHYTETYYFDMDSDIIKDFCSYTENNGIIKINGVKTDIFNKYINNEDELNEKKYEFITSRSTQTHERLINDNKAVISSIISSFDVDVANKTDYQYNRVFRMDYLNGITYDPKADIDVFIERGNAAAMERHIKLGEIKTLDDMIMYSNGSFFNIENTSG
jgi:hypothetical protein